MPGDVRQCYTIDILEDDLCEIDPLEFFQTVLTFRSGNEPITVAPDVALVIIDDNSEPECGESIKIIIVNHL